MSWQTILAIGSGGFLGAIARVYFIGLINRNVVHDLPFGTLGVNIVGSLILGGLFALFTYTEYFQPPMKSFLSTGLMGAFTTYSTFALETFWLASQGSLLLALLNTLLNVTLTILAAGSGFKLIEQFFK